MISRSFKTEAIILRRVSFSETDRIVTLFTPKHGKLRCIAKGIKRIHSRKAAHLELFNQVYAFIIGAKTFGIITEVTPVRTFRKLRENLVGIAYVYKAVEQVDRLCAEEEVHMPVYRSLVNFLSFIENSQEFKYAHLSEQFSRELLWDLGYLPKTTHLSGNALQHYLIQIMEIVPKSEGFLTRVTHKSTI